MPGMLSQHPTTSPPHTISLGRPFVGLALAGVLLLSGCGNGNSPAGTSATPESTLQTAPDSARIDLDMPTFSDPTTITNPLFPISELTQVVQVGTEGDVALRHEITLLPEIKTIEWEGQQIDTLVSQFAAYGDGRILEVARDFFAQADDGSVWYFGEDVQNYIDGVLDNTDGTWLAGKDGPPGMLMPADPQVGDVYRPENIPGFVFEEVTVKSITDTVDGPQGPISGALLVEELLMDGVLEDKIFAPGYGEFKAQVVSESELVHVSVGVPLDAVGGKPPAELDQLATVSADVYTAAGAADWAAVAALLHSLTTAWASYRDTGVPPLTADGMDVALEALTSAAATQEAAVTQQAANDLAYVMTDLRLRHAPPATVDVGRMDILARQVLLDAAAEQQGFLTGDATHLEAVWNRISHAIQENAVTSIDGVLTDLRAAAESGDYTASAAAALALRQALSGL
ncbi:MAG: hypothetical protein M3381_14125 [Actinomycetota bacterium]|nr:hypothetical protein [Actinomycetota bacterium]